MTGSSSVHREEIEARAKGIKLLILDVDGVLTDGLVFYSDGGAEVKAFNVQDGHGIKLARRAGLRVAFLSGRNSDSVARRAEELQVDLIFQGVTNKLEVYERLSKEEALSPEQIAYVGDDVVDIPVMRRIGLPVAVADAVEEVKAEALMITERGGGRGAVREVIDFILKAQRKHEQVMRKYYT